MQNSLAQKDCLKLFNTVVTQGKKHDSYYEFEDIKAWYDFDGYTCYLQYNQLIMTMQFHGKYRLEYPNKDDFHQFETKLAKICAKLT